MKKITALLTLIIGAYYLPQSTTIPVKGASKKDWNAYSYWYHPWGKSVVHKGIDIFGQENTPVLASVNAWVIFTGNIKQGGNVVALIDSKSRIHYFAHLDRIETRLFSVVPLGKEIGKLGTTGNAAGKPPHLHYSVFSLIPNPIDITLEPQGWKRMFYVNPNGLFKQLN